MTGGGESINLLGKKDVKDADVDAKPYTSTQNTKHAEQGKTERGGDMTSHSREFAK